MLWRRVSLARVSFFRDIVQPSLHSSSTTLCLFLNLEKLVHNECITQLAGGVNLVRGRTENNWAQCLVDDIIRVFEATKGSTDSSPLFYCSE